MLLYVIFLRPASDFLRRLVLSFFYCKYHLDAYLHFVNSPHISSAPLEGEESPTWLYCKATCRNLVGEKNVYECFLLVLPKQDKWWAGVRRHRSRDANMEHRVPWCSWPLLRLACSGAQLVLSLILWNALRHLWLGFTVYKSKFFDWCCCAPHSKEQATSFDQPKTIGHVVTLMSPRVQVWIINCHCLFHEAQM